ncbi:MAG: ORF6N domain-containing protein [Ignavibacteriales bacterium]|nr:ORF6N domain-containing protein [Ignavibacteriales bacterium]
MTELIRNRVVSLIRYFRGQKVILDSDIAQLYGVETKRLKEAVRRNIERFPHDFMFKLSREEYASLRSQIASLKRGQHSKYLPFAFTEQGVAMLSSILNSKRAIQVNIAIMRAFVELRKMIDANKELLARIEKLEEKYDSKFQIVFEAIKELMKEDEKPKNKIGF